MLCANRLLDYDCRWTELRGAIARQGVPVAVVAVDNWYSILLYPMAGATDFGGEPERWQSLATTTTYDRPDPLCEFDSRYGYLLNRLPGPLSY